MSKKRTTRAGRLVVIAVAAIATLQAGNIHGTVVVRTKLTKRRVTASVPMYERGPAVELGADRENDPLAFERSRVAVYLDGQFPEQAAAKTVEPRYVATMGQAERRFSPETLVIGAGSSVSFPNMDPVFHNVFSLSGPKSFDLGNYPRGETRVVLFPKPGIVYVNCHLHPNMTATIVVAPNQWNTRADRDGRFELKDVPAGKYTVVAWHKAAGFFRQTVSIAADETREVEFLIPLDENGRRLDSSAAAFQQRRK